MTTAIMDEISIIKEQQRWITAMVTVLERKLIGHVPEYSYKEFHDVWDALKTRSHKHEIVAGIMESDQIHAGKKGINVSGLLRAAQEEDSSISLADVRGILAEAQRAFLEYS